MPAPTSADTIRILVSTDNHVGFSERDHIRGDDSWKSFHEVMCLAKERDVDLVLLAGDLFHENKPSRKSMYQVMRSLRMNCLGDKPCELEMLSDASENFQGAFNHVNYEDQDINVAIPVFSIHGNHDDPSGEHHLAALDLLQISGLVNYYGRTPESDNIQVKPVLLQKGRTKLALYGLSNVRDERLFRTFRDGKVKFFQPSRQKGDWFNLLSVHQNHHAYTETGFLNEDILPNFIDLVVWGHEHECIIDPRFNPTTQFHVMQPGSSVATSLVPGEAVPKQVAIVSVTGKNFKSESIPLKTVRPFVMREIVLQDEPGMKVLAKKENNRTAITRHLEGIVLQLIEQAKDEWMATQDPSESDEELEAPLPLVRLRVEYTAPEGGRFDVENPQRFSNRFVEKVANVHDVVQFHRKKTIKRTNKEEPELPSESAMEQLSADNIKVEKLVHEYLAAQQLTIFPPNSFGDAVNQYVDKDDKHAMEVFVESSLIDQVKNLLKKDDDDEVDEAAIAELMSRNQLLLDQKHAQGQLPKRTRKLKPKPDGWDSDIDGEWSEQPAAFVLAENEDAEEDGADDIEPPTDRGTATRGRGRGRGGAKTAGAPRKTASTTKKPTPAAKSVAKKPPSRRKTQDEGDDDGDDDDDVIMLDEEEEEDMVTVTKAKATRAPPSGRVASPAKRPAARSASARQTTLNFSQPSTSTAKKGAGHDLSDDEISDDDDDDDAFDPPTTTRSGKRR